MKKLYISILLLTFFILTGAGVSAQDAGFSASASVNRQSAAPGETIILTLVIDYPVPSEISVYVPLYSDFLSLDRISAFPRYIDGRVQNIVEYRFIAIRAGRFVLEPFTIVCPAGVTETRPVVIEITNPGAVQVFMPRLVWDAAATVSAGDRITLTLKSNNWSSPQPPPSFFMPQVPQGVILSPLSVSAEERAGGVIMKLQLIPLAPGDVHLPARTLVQNNIRFEIPALDIRVNP